MKLQGHLVRNAGKLVSIVFLAMAMASFVPIQAQSEAQSSYSIVILDKQTRDAAERGKQLLEGWGYSPIIINQLGDQYSVLYGEFESNAAALRVKDRLQGEGISAKGVTRTQISAEPETLIKTGNFGVVVQEFKTSSNAMLLQQTLSQAGFTPVSVRQTGNYYRVMVSDLSREEAILMLGQLRQQGYMTARVRKMESLAITPTVPVPTRSEQTPATASEDFGISAAVMQTDLWNELSEDQKRQVIKSMAIQEQLRKGDTLAQEVIDINKRLNSLDDNVRRIISQIENEKSTTEQVRLEIDDLFKEADNLMRAGEFQECIVRLNKVVSLDKDNLYGQAAFARRRIATAESRLRDERYEGQSTDVENKYQALKADAERLSVNKNSVSDLQTALGLWVQIKNLDPQKYGATANSRVSDLKGDLENLSQSQSLALTSSNRMMLYIALGLGGGFILLFILLMLVWLRGRARHNQLLMKVQEITSIRPMRELQGGPTGMLEGSSDGEASESDIFAPMTPKESPELKDEDSFGGLGATSGLVSETPAAETSPVEDLFGEASVDEDAPTVNAMGDDLNFDDIFGGNGSAKETESTVASEPPMVEEPETPKAELTQPETIEPLAEELPETVVNREPESASVANNGEAISFDDILAASSGPDEVVIEPLAAEEPVAPAAEDDESSEDLLALFDDAVGPSADETVPEGSPGLDHLKDSPGSSILGDVETKPGVAASPVMEDETEIPSINLNAEETHSEETVEGETTRVSEDLPSFSLDDITSFDEVPATQQSAPMPQIPKGDEIVNLDFQGDLVGQKPGAWDGEYDYASLTVEDDNPPSDGGRYLSFSKLEGGGKAYYSCRFPEVSGKFAIEFDMCCKEKNKFLLGFYIEKDAQFQKSIHTKILRSETQTTPTIHMQGESAPYLLGSWAHIKYLVDLDEGKLNGYIDSTHVAHDLSLVQNPGSLNTFSIRDNINTTGVMMLANLRIYSVQ